ncbi:MAG: HK97 gp10 family phage protein [Ruminococcus sp.]|nr:HK97 gp10 family phage protein [Ruminococcus sp.]
MADKIDIEDLLKAMLEAYTQYTEEVIESLEQELQEVAKEARKEVKQLSPVYTGKYKTVDNGRYRRGWRILIEKSNGRIRVTVHNRIYQLTHLLEDGHVNRDGTTQAKAFPHIGVANQHAEEKIDKFLENL